MAKRMPSITIRLSPEHMRALKARAESRGLQPAPYIRSLVADLLEGEEQQEVGHALRELMDRIDGVRHAIGKATTVILADLQTTTKLDKKHVLSPEYIREWVGNNILS